LQSSAEDTERLAVAIAATSVTVMTDQSHLTLGLSTTNYNMNIVRNDFVEMKQTCADAVPYIAAFFGGFFRGRERDPAKILFISSSRWLS
jgi:hypothetical protein